MENRPTFRVNLLKARAAAMRRLFKLSAALEANCDRMWTISPGEQTAARPAAFLDGELDRVVGVQEDTTFAAEWSRVKGGLRRHAPTTAYRLKRVRLLDGRLFRGALNLRVSQMSGCSPRHDDIHVAAAAVSSTLMGSLYFGHWMHDDLTLRLAAQALSFPIDVARHAYGHEPGYRRLLSLDEQSIARARFEELIVMDDWGQNSNKRHRYRELRNRLRAAVPGKGNDRVYIKRGRSRAFSGRDLLNGAALETHLVARGFAVIDPDAMTADQIAASARDAKLVVGLEGSHLAHAIYPMADDGALVVLQPPRRFNNVFKDIADAIALRYAFTVGRQDANGFHADLDRIDRLLDLLGTH